MISGKRKPKPEADDPDSDYVDPDDADDDNVELALAAARRKRQIQIVETAGRGQPDFSEPVVHMSPEQRRAALESLDDRAASLRPRARISSP